MGDKRRYFFTFIAGLLVLILLTGLTLANLPTRQAIMPTVLFAVLFVFTVAFGVPLGGGVVSLLPMMIVASYLSLGSVPTAWALLASSFVHGYIRHRWPERIEHPVEAGRLAQLNLAIVNATILPLTVLIAGAIYRIAGGITPLVEIHLADVPLLVLLGITSYGANLLLVGFYFALWGRSKFVHYLRSLPDVFFYESYPIAFSPLVAIVFTRLGLGLFILFSLAIIGASFIMHNLAHARQRLERRVREMVSLQAVGQALSASLNLDTILSTIHGQVALLMPAEDFYVALYNQQVDEVSFPLAVEKGEIVRRPPRRGGNGLTEHILRTKTPMLVQGNINLACDRLGLKRKDQPSVSFLGVPILAGSEPLGVIVVQSYSVPHVYDASHREVLSAVAAQAAVAIQNARLYTRTDEALTRRVQEFDSILETAHEGILLLDFDFRVLAVNRALAELLDIPTVELTRYSPDASPTDVSALLIGQPGFKLTDIQADCREFTQKGQDILKKTFTLPGSPEVYIERNLTAVRNQQEEITGWLYVFHDLTEERELERMRDEMTHMIIHDLRSPLNVVQGSLNVIEESLVSGSVEDQSEIIQLARRSSERVLRLANELLDIHRFEGGQMPLHLETVQIGPMLMESATQFTPLAMQTQITLDVDVAPNLPALNVDLGHVGRVLSNLLDNAFKFTSDGGRIRLWSRLDDTISPHVLCIGVSDTGRGISSRDQTRLFQKFQHVSQEGRWSGTGLGLVYSRLAVEAHGGTIEVESEPGQGSTFIVRLPVPASPSV